VLLPHWFDGVEDTDLIARLMHDHHGPPPDTGNLHILELGCGTGRVTTALAPYAASLHGVDSGAPMVDVFRARYPAAHTTLADIRTAVADLRAGDQRFDVVGAFWSLSYPIGDCFEVLTADGIRPRPDLEQGIADAHSLVHDIVDLLADGGHLLALFFDSDTPEQQVVTRAWERLAPFPGTGRAFARETLLEALRSAENEGLGRLSHTRIGGVSVAETQAAAIDWFTIVHLKSMPALVTDPDTRTEIEAFVSRHTAHDGRVLLPTGVHAIDFWRGPVQRHLPAQSGGHK
jgi:SAM-dependent methyltransferase